MGSLGFSFLRLINGVFCQLTELSDWAAAQEFCQAAYEDRWDFVARLLTVVEIRLPCNSRMERKCIGLAMICVELALQESQTVLL